MRELYDHDVRRGLQGIDTGFGVLSQAVASQNAAGSAIAFADTAPGQNQVVEGDANESAAIRLELLEDYTHHDEEVGYKRGTNTSEPSGSGIHE